MKSILWMNLAYFPDVYIKLNFLVICLLLIMLIDNIVALVSCELGLSNQKLWYEFI